MRIYTRAGDLAFKTFTFPDGQPHFQLETYERDFAAVTVEVGIRNPTDLFTTLLCAEVLRQHGYSEVNLDIRYLLGARMDRAIDTLSPFTLSTVARLLNGAGFSRVRILDVHSEVATRLIRNSVNVLPVAVVNQVLTVLMPTSFVIPDKGAEARGAEFYKRTPFPLNIVYGQKHRDMATGALSGFSIQNPTYVGSSALIVDDICDGGGTFVGLAKELRVAGAQKVYLYVTHGIFSKRLPLEGIDRVFTTDSYLDGPVNRQGGYLPDLTIIPVSMKELS